MANIITDRLGFLELDNTVSIQMCLSEYSLRSLLEARLHDGEEYPSHGHVVAWCCLSRHFPARLHRHRARNITYGHLVTLLLHS